MNYPKEQGRSWLTKFQMTKLEDRRTITLDPTEAYEAGFDQAFILVFDYLFKNQDTTQLDALQSLYQKLKREY